MHDGRTGLMSGQDKDFGYLHMTGGASLAYTACRSCNQNNFLLHNIVYNVLYIRYILSVACQIWAKMFSSSVACILT